jgi:hypothetical protein
VAAKDSHDTLYRGNGNGTFTLANTIVGRRKQVSTAGVWGDFDKDGWLDLFVATVGNNPGEQAADNILYQSDRQGGFKPISFRNQTARRGVFHHGRLGRL